MTGLYQLRDYQEYNGQGILNVYNFLGTGNDVTAQVLAEAFLAFIMPTILPLQTSLLEHVGITVINLLDESDAFKVTPIGYVGSQGDAGLPTFNTWSFQSLSPIAGAKSGGKRIAGVTEGDIAFGEPTVNVQQRLDAFANVYAATFSVAGLDVLFYPMIDGRLGGVPAFNLITNAVFRRLGTQNTRKDYSGGGALSIDAKVSDVTIDIAFGPPGPTVSPVFQGKEEFVQQYGGLYGINRPVTKQVAITVNP